MYHQKLLKKLIDRGLILLNYGKNKTNGKKVCTRKAPKEDSCSKERSCWRWKETSSFQTRNRCSSSDSQIPKEHRVTLEETSFPEISQGDCSDVQRARLWFAIPVFCYCSSSRSSWSLFGWIVWGYKLVCYSRKESDHHAKGYELGKKNQRREDLNPFPEERGWMDLIIRLKRWWVEHVYFFFSAILLRGSFARIPWNT